MSAPTMHEIAISKEMAKLLTRLLGAVGVLTMVEANVDATEVFGLLKKLDEIAEKHVKKPTIVKR